MGDFRGNLTRATEAVRRAIGGGTDLVVLPEAWATGFALDHLAEWAEVAPRALEALHRVAEGWDGALVAGTLFIREGESHFNAVHVLRRGEVVAVYRKMHLFAGLGEDTAFAPGDDLVTIETPLGPAGLAVCYDLRFPELFRRLVLQGARLFVLPSQWPHPRIDHWRLLLQARAVENLAPVIGVNAAGNPEADRLHGHSMVVAPWGEILWEAGQESVVEVVEIDGDALDEARARLPALGDARPDLLAP